MYVRMLTVTPTTDASGDVTSYSEVATGAVHSIKYLKVDYDNGVDFTITNETTGETIWTQSNVNATAVVAPRQATHGTDGTATLYAAGGTAVQTPVLLANQRIKIVIAQGGNAKSGTFYIFIA